MQVRNQGLMENDRYMLLIVLLYFEVFVLLLYAYHKHFPIFELHK